MTRSRALFASMILGCAGACTVPPPPAEMEAELMRRTAVALDAVSSGHDPSAAAAAIAAARSVAVDLDDRKAAASGLAERLDVLAAVVEKDREARLDRLDAVKDAARDPLFEKLVDHMKEQDDLYLADKLEGDTVWSWVAGFFDGVMQTGFAILNANPIGAIKPIGRGLDALIQEDEPDVRDRKRVQLFRRFERQYGKDKLPEEAKDLAKEVQRLEDANFRQEERLVDRLLDQKRIDAAAAHLHVAQTMRPAQPTTSAIAARVDAAFAEAAERLKTSLSFTPAEPGLAGAERELVDPYRGALERIAMDSIAPQDLATLAQQARSFGRAELATSLDYAAALLAAEKPTERGAALEKFRDANLKDPRGARADVRRASEWFDPFAPIEAARERHRREREDYVATGKLVIRDPLRRYEVVRKEAQRSVLDALEPIFWFPATIVRSVYNGFVDPIDDRPIVDALAHFVNRSPDDPRRKDALNELVDRYERRDDPRKALALARLSGANPAEQKRIEDQVAASLLARIETVNSPAARRQALEKLLERYPESDVASRIREQLVQLPDIPVDGVQLPPTALQPWAGELGIHRKYLDGLTSNGEVTEGGIRFLGDHLDYSVSEFGHKKDFTVALTGKLKDQMSALAREWDWRHRAARASTYEELHSGFPVELYAGIGPGGLAAYPRLLPEDYQSSDKSLFQ